MFRTVYLILFCDFLPISRCISQTIQDSAVTAKGTGPQGHRARQRGEIDSSHRLFWLVFHDYVIAFAHDIDSIVLLHQLSEVYWGIFQVRCGFVGVFSHTGKVWSIQTSNIAQSQLLHQTQHKANF